MPNGTIETQELCKLGEFLVDLIKNQDHVAHKWLEFLISIEVGLAVALGFLLRFGGGKNAVLSNVALYLIPAIGIAVALALTWIVIRERKWQAWFVTRFNVLPGFEGRVFPLDKGDPTKTVGSQPVGRISQIVFILAFLISLGWVGVLWTISANPPLDTEAAIKAPAPASSTSEIKKPHA